MEHSLHSALNSAQLLELRQAGQHAKAHLCRMGAENNAEGHSPDTPRAQKRRHSQTNTHVSYLSFAESRLPVAQNRQTEPNASAQTLALPTCTALQLPLPQTQTYTWIQLGSGTEGRTSVRFLSGDNLHIWSPPN